MKCFVFKSRRTVKGVIRERPNYYAKLRMPWEDRDTVWALPTTDRTEAERLLKAKWQKREELHRKGLPTLPPPQPRKGALNGLLAAFLRELEAQGLSKGTLKKYANMRVMFERLGWKDPGDVDPFKFSNWRAQSELAPKTLNDFLANTNGFFRWLRNMRKVTEIPLEHVRPLKPRRQGKYRRALTHDEAQRLLQTAPRHRALIYLIFLRTGLRRTELRNLLLSDLRFEQAEPYIFVRAEVSKNRTDATVNALPEVVAAFREFIPAGAPPSFQMFATCLPRGSTYMKDFKAAGIPLVDHLGRKVDVHALRGTFITDSVLAGNSIVEVQQLARHKHIETTMKYYVDVSQLRLAQAAAKLPKLSLTPAVIEKAI